MFAVLRYASVASLLTAVALPLACFLSGASWPVVGFGAACSVWRVFCSIGGTSERLFAGTEPRFARGSRERAPA